MSDLATPIVVLAVLGLVAFLIFKGAQHARQKAQERRTALRLLGFEPAADPGRDAPVLLELCRRGKGDHYRVENLLERPGSEHRLLLFDLRDTSGDSDRPALLAVTSPRLALPRFTLFPRIESEGRLAALANTVLEKVVPREGRAVGFPEDSAFSRRYSVVGPDEGEIRRFFDKERLGALAEREHLMIEAAGDAFTVGRIRMKPQPRPREVSDVSETVEEAERLFRLFSRRR